MDQRSGLKQNISKVLNKRHNVNRTSMIVDQFLASNLQTVLRYHLATSLEANRIPEDSLRKYLATFPCLRSFVGQLDVSSSQPTGSSGGGGGLAISSVGMWSWVRFLPPPKLDFR